MRPVLDWAISKVGFTYKVCHAIATSLQHFSYAVVFIRCILSLSSKSIGLRHQSKLSGEGPRATLANRALRKVGIGKDAAGRCIESKLFYLL